MKYLRQFGLILLFSFLGEALRALIPLPVPASIYGMALLFLALAAGMPLSAVEDTGDFLIEIMPVLFIPAGVGVLGCWGELKAMPAAGGSLRYAGHLPGVRGLRLRHAGADSPGTAPGRKWKMTEFFGNAAYFAVLACLGLYQAGAWLKKKTGLAFLNPLLVSIAGGVGVLLLLRVDSTSFARAAQPLSWLLTPATVCLAIPLYRQVRLVRKYALSLLAGIAAGVAASILSVLVIALIFEMDHAGYVTLLPKSITTAIGMVVSREQGGVENITVAVIVLTGVFGNLMASPLCRLFRLTDPVARGVAIGTSSHAIGTARAMEMDDVTGAVSGLSIAVSGVLTVAAAAILGNLV